MSKKKSHYGKAGLVFEELEPRLLLSADPLAVAVDAGAAIVQEHKLENDQDLTEIIHTGKDESLVGVRNELVVIDARAPNFQQLHNDLIQAQQQGRQIHVVVLDAHRDGIEQINTALESFNQLDAVHIVSHGDNGRLLLGSTQLDTTTLREHAQTVSQWTNRFSDNGDLLIYGCKLAETAEGRSLASMLGHLTGTDVAASDDLTGHQILGGDWEFEYQAGDIETPVAFSDDVQQTWQGTLQAPAPAGAEQQQAATNQQQQAEIEAEAVEQQAASTQTDKAGSAQYREEEPPADAEEQRQEVVFIDWTVNDFGTFVDYLKNDADDSTRFDVILLDTERNGVEQIEEVLSGYRDVDAVHIIAHGGDGAIKLGDAWFNTDNIDQYSESLMAWAGAFDQHTDILFYGCNLAESTGGEHFIDRLAQLTGADVAASDDLTGHHSKGGDWDLEYRAGSVETAVAIDATTQAAYRDTLSTFVVSNTNATGAGSLHQAILDANANTGVVDTITFNLTGAGPHIISLSGPLPVIDEAVIIDGTTEPDFSYAGDGSPRPVVVIDGSSAGTVDGLVIGASGGGSTIRGLVIQNFQNDGILLLGGNNTITANILGLQADGITIAGNNLAGAGIHGNIRIESANNIIGGLTPAERNIISGSGFSGIALFGAGATGNQILGNFIGTDITGTLARGNAQEGIEIQDAGGNIIGGTVAGARNVISANGSDGMEIDNGDNNTIQGNFIGTDITGMLALGNVRDGIDLNENSGAGATGNLIGGTDPNAANLIAYNSMYGIEVRDAPTINNTILGNSIYNNGLIGIQLTTDGVVTLNDPGDADADSNNQQNFPVLTTADTNTIDTIVVDGSLNSTANSYFRIEFFASSTADGSGYGEGETFLGHVNVATDGSGNASFSAVLSATVANGAVISATATKSDASYSTFTDTSEFAATINAVGNFAAAATDDPQAYSSYLTSLGPSGYWRLGESAGVTAVDATGLNDGTYNGGTPGEGGAISADGDTALQFDGVDDYMELADNPAYLLDDGTVQFWFKTTDVTQRADLFSKDALGYVTGGHLSIYLDGSGNIETRLQSTSTSYYVTSTLPLTNNQWHHVAFSFGAGGMQLYVDGQLQDSDAYTGGMGTTSGGTGNVEPIAIGASTQVSNTGSATPLQDYFSGAMDEVALFGTALTPDQIRNLYAGGLQNYSVTEDNTLNVSAAEGVLINDYDQEGDALTAMLVSGPSNAASFTLYNDGSFDYTPVANFNGSDSFTYLAHDGTSASNVATVTITVTAVNDVPVATTNTVTVMEDTAYIFTAADFTFTDAEGDALVSATISNLSLAGGSLAHSGGISVNNGDTLSAAQLVTLVYLPAANASGAPLALFDFSVNDTGAGTVTAQMDIDVTPVNDVPVAIANTVTTTANTAYTFSAADFTYNDVESDALMSATITNLSLAGGTLTYSGGITLNDGDTLSAFQLDTLVYTPPVNITGAPLATFDFRVNDAGPGVVPAQMAIDVNIVNSVPVALANTVNTLEDTAYSFTAADFTYSDAEGDALVSATLSNLSLAGGTLTHSGGTAVVDGDTLTVAQLDTLVYTPAANANGTPLASFDFSVNDGGPGVITATMSIDVSAQPDTAVIGGVDSGSVTEDVDPDMNSLLEVSGSLTISDPDAGEAAFNTGVFGGTYGVITLNATGDWNYAANTTQAVIQGLADGETLTDTISVSSVDGTSHNIVITIIGTNDAPTANGIADVTVNEDAAATPIDLNAAFADPDNLDAELSFAIVGNSQIGLFTSTGIDVVTGRLTLDYAADMNGAAQISIRATDPAGQSVDTLFTVTVNPVNDMPVLQTNTGAVTMPGTPATISNGQLNATDIDNSTAELVYTLTTLPANGELLLNDVVMTLNDSFTQADIDSNRLVYRSSVPAADHFGFILSDGAGGALGENTFSIVVQLAPTEDSDVRDEPPPIESEQDEEMSQQQTSDTENMDFREATNGNGGGYEPFGSTSTPPVPQQVPPPASVVRAEPVPTAELSQPIEPVEDLEYTATAVEDYKISTFVSVQVKSMTALWSAIDQMKHEIADSAEKQTSVVEIRVAAAETTGVVLTAGVVAWILRSGALFSSLISTIPLWKGYDPLPILAYEDDQDDKEDTIDENKIPTSMEDLKKLKQVMKQKQQAENEVDVDSMFGGSTIRE